LFDFALKYLEQRLEKKYFIFCHKTLQMKSQSVG